MRRLAGSSALIDWMRKSLDNVVVVQNDVQANCPFCESRTGRPDTKHHLGASIYKKAAHCFRCEWTGSWYDLVREVEGCSFREASRILSHRPTLEEYYRMVEDLGEQVAEPVKPSGLEEYIPLAEAKDSVIGKFALEYLERRGFQKYAFRGLFGIVPGELRLYILASPTYWQARALFAVEEPKYRNPSHSVGPTLGIWDSPGMEQVHEMSGPVYVAEGMFSALAIVDRGCSALALLGKMARSEQLERIAQIQREIVIALDADAHREAWDLARRLQGLGRQDVRVALLSEGDPADGWDVEMVEGDWTSYTRWRLR